MKKSTLLFIVLGLLIIGGLTSAKYHLREKYNQIDKTNLYNNYSKIVADSFSHIKIEGKNNTIVKIESNETDALYIKKEYEAFIHTEIKKDTLYIRFEEKEENVGQENRIKDFRQSIIIQCNSLASIFSDNAHIDLELQNETKLSLDIKGSSTLNIVDKNESLKELSIVSDDFSEIIINEKEGSSNLKFVQFYLSGESNVELYSAVTDSFDIQSSPTSNLMANSRFFN